MDMAAAIHYTADVVRAMPDDGNRREWLVWHPAGAGAAFTLALEALFRPIDPDPPRRA